MDAEVKALEVQRLLAEASRQIARLRQKGHSPVPMARPLRTRLGLKGMSRTSLARWRLP